MFARVVLVFLSQIGCDENTNPKDGTLALLLLSPCTMTEIGLAQIILKALLAASMRKMFSFVLSYDHLTSEEIIIYFFIKEYGTQK